MRMTTPSTYREVVLERLRRGEKIKKDEIAGARQEIGFSPSTRSAIDQDYTIQDIIVEKMRMVIEARVNEEPNITHVSINQFMYGAGDQFNDFEFPFNQGLLSHCGICVNNQYRGTGFVYQPTNKDLALMLKNYGMMLDWPPPAIRSTLMGVIRNLFVNPALDGKQNEFRIGRSIGVIDEKTGLYKPEYARATSGFFIDSTDPATNENKKRWLAESPLWRKKLWHLFCDRLFTSARAQELSGAKRIDRAIRLRAMYHFDDQGGSPFLESISPYVNPLQIDWDRNEVVDIDPEDD